MSERESKNLMGTDDKKKACCANGFCTLEQMLTANHARAVCMRVQKENSRIIFDAVIVGDILRRNTGRGK